MKHLYSGVALALIASFTACQSENGQTSATQQQAQQEQPQSSATTGHAQAQPQQTQTPPLVKEVAQQLPDFNFYKVKSGISFSKADIPAGKNTVFILFDPNCGHCQHEAGHLAKNYDKLKDVNIYFVSMNDPALMASFLDTFGKELVDKPNVEVLYDRNQEFIQKIHVPEQFPANYIYGADGKLKNSWDGEKEVGFILAEFTK